MAESVQPKNAKGQWEVDKNKNTSRKSLEVSMTRECGKVWRGTRSLAVWFVLNNKGQSPQLLADKTSVDDTLGFNIIANTWGTGLPKLQDMYNEKKKKCNIIYKM
eukprot:403395_1